MLLQTNLATWDCTPGTNNKELGGVVTLTMKASQPVMNVIMSHTNDTVHTAIQRHSAKDTYSIQYHTGMTRHDLEVSTSFHGFNRTFYQSALPARNCKMRVPAPRLEAEACQRLDDFSISPKMDN